MFLELHVKNFCQHQDLNILFHPRTNLIIGENGAGKSNLLLALRFALTGAIDQRRIAQLIRHGCNNSEVILRCRYSKQDILIKRTLCLRRKRCVTSHYAKIADSEYDSAGDIIVALNKIFSADISIIDSLFIPQGRIDNLLSLSTAQKAEEFFRKLGIRNLSYIWEYLGQRISQIPVLQAPDLSNYVTAYNEAEVKYISLQKELANIPIISDEELQKIKNEINRYEQAQQILKNIKSLQDSCFKTQQQIENLEQKLKEQQITLIEKEIERTKTIYEQYKDDLKAWNKYHEAQAEREKLQKEFNYIFQLFNCRPNIPKCIFISDEQKEQLDALKQKQTLLQNELNLTTTIIKTSVCPTCKRPIKENINILELRNKISELSAAIQKINVEISNLSALFEKAKQIKESAEIAKKFRRDLRFRIQNLKKRIQIQITPGKIPYDDLLLKIQQIEHLQEQYALITKERQAIINQLSVLQGQLFAYNEELSSQQRTFEKLKPLPTQEKVEKFKQFLSFAEQNKINRISAQHAANAAQALFESAKKALLQAQQQEAKSAKRNELLNKLHSLRALFRRDALPSKIISAYLTLLLRRINDILAEFDAGFTVQLGSDFNFDAVFNGSNYKISDQFLSGGQRVILALAIHLAMAVVLTGFEVLILDEPTEFLSQKNRNTIGHIFERVSNLCSDRSLQLIVVTHDTTLIPHFENVILINNSKSGDEELNV